MGSVIKIKKGKELPENVEISILLDYLQTSKRESNKLFTNVKEISNMSDNAISQILDISPKTFRNYKSVKQILSLRLAEHAIAFYAVFYHGKKVFGTEQEFTRWLNQENFYFDGKAPIKYLSVISGIKFIDDRLTAMEFGDNV